MMKAIIYFPVVSDEQVVAIWTIGKTDEGTLFCNFGQAFCELLNKKSDESYIFIGDGNSIWTEEISDEQTKSSAYTDEKMRIDFQSPISDDSLTIGCLNIIDSKKILTPVVPLTDLLHNEKNIGSAGKPLSAFLKLREPLINLLLQQGF